jgi:hypothetical protein
VSAYNFATPITDTTYMTLAGSSTLSFALGSTDSVSLVDLTNTAGSGSLTFNLHTPYLLVSATSGLDSSYAGLVLAIGTGASTTYILSNGDSTNENGWVVGVATSAIGTNGGGYTGTSLPTGDYTPIAITEYEANGSTELTTAANGVYPAPALYLDNGDLEVVPEPGTWAMMLGGLGVLLFIQSRRRRNT